MTESTATARDEWHRYTRDGLADRPVALQEETADSLAYVYDECLRTSRLMRDDGMTAEQSGVVVLSHLHRYVQTAVDQLTTRKLAESDPDVVAMFREVAGVHNNEPPSQEEIMRTAFDLLLIAMKYLACITGIQAEDVVITRAREHHARVRARVLDKVAQLRACPPESTQAAELISELRILLGDLSTDGTDHATSV